MIQYCKRCCLPSTKPHLSFDEEGICNACRNYENRKNVDWDERKNVIAPRTEATGTALFRSAVERTAPIR